MLLFENNDHFVRLLLNVLFFTKIISHPFEIFYLLRKPETIKRFFTFSCNPVKENYIVVANSF